MSTVTLLVMTDGRRHCIEQSVPAALSQLDGDIANILIHDDSGDPDYRAWLAQQFPAADIAWHPAGRQGFGAAIRNAWRHVQSRRSPFVFHLEDDFILRRRVDLEAMMRVLDASPNLVQLALRRQPWNDAERAAGGIVEQHPDAYEDMVMGDTPDHWLTHRLFFTTNPSLYRKTLTQTEWPLGGNSEGHYSHKLLEDPEIRFGFWGSRDSGEWVEHIGHARAGVGY